MAEGKKFEIRIPEKKSFEIRKTLHDIDPIEEGGLTPQSREDLERLVEAPLLEAARIFFDKKISTTMSSANKKDLASGEVYIIISCEGLSSRNRELALQHGTPFKHLGREFSKLVMPVNENTTVKEISEYMVHIANQFESQR